MLVGLGIVEGDRPTLESRIPNDHFNKPCHLMLGGAARMIAAFLMNAKE